MRALRVSPGARLSWLDVPVLSPPGPLGASVHPIAVATCDLDRAVVLGRTPFLLPLHPGPESVAEVTAMGSAVTSVRVGQRVVVPFQISCGSCAPCRLGLTSNCLAVPPISMYGLGLGWRLGTGAVPTLTLSVPFADGMLVPLPDEVEPARLTPAARRAGRRRMHPTSCGVSVDDQMVNRDDGPKLDVGAHPTVPPQTCAGYQPCREWMRTPSPCLTGDAPAWRRMARLLVPRRGGRECCDYQRGDWVTVAKIEVRLVQSSGRPWRGGGGRPSQAAGRWCLCCWRRRCGPLARQGRTRRVELTARPCQRRVK